MSHLRLLMIAFAAILVVALAAFALVQDLPVAPGDDDIIIKGGSLDIECGKNHKSDNAGCLALDDAVRGRFKHKQKDKHIKRVVVRNTNTNTTVFDSDKTGSGIGGKPEIIITYK
ncbi:MAG TPA: hypothetical protein VEW46_22955 [Pyrinomonadaceae bacterium]|nr:hypothetical protein [Pyrinomonadaceae bacterium]